MVITSHRFTLKFLRPFHEWEDAVPAAGSAPAVRMVVAAAARIPTDTRARKAARLPRPNGFASAKGDSSGRRVVFMK